MPSSMVRITDSADEALPKNHEGWKRRASSACPIVAKELRIHPDTARASTWQISASQPDGSPCANAEVSPPFAFTVPSLPPAGSALEQPAGNTALHYAEAAASDATSADKFAEHIELRYRTPRDRFPEALYRMLSAPRHAPIISWNDFGDGFIIHDLEKFKSILLPEYYRATRFSSFVRQLYAYGFKHSASQAAHGVGSVFSKPIEYFHNHFRKGSFDKAKSMKRQARNASQDFLEAQLSSEYCSRRNDWGNDNKKNNSGSNAMLTGFGHMSPAEVSTPFASPLDSQVDLPASDARSNGHPTLTTETLQTALEHLGHLETAVRHLQNDKASLSTLHRCLQLLYQQLRDTLRAHPSDSPWRLADTDVGEIHGTLAQPASLSETTIVDLRPYDNSLTLFTPSQNYSAEDVSASQTVLQPLMRPATDWQFTQAHMA